MADRPPLWGARRQVRVFVDANVLASPVPRTVLYLAQPLSDFELVFSPWVEAEADRHQKPGQASVSRLRERWDWQVVPDADEFDDLIDTDPKDQIVLASAVEARAQFLVTGNVRDFGEKDLIERRMVAVHPGLFLAHHLTAAVYREVLTVVGEARAREPRDPFGIHVEEIATHLPALFERYADLFGPIPAETEVRHPKTVFRGGSCVRCTVPLPEVDQHAPGLCLECRSR